jgi:hypothetical protein
MSQLKESKSMSKLNVGNMDNVPTGPDILPNLKNVALKVLEPTNKEEERVEYKDGKMKAINFTVQVVERTPYVSTIPTAEGERNVERNAEGRVLSLRCTYHVDKDLYMTWKGSSESAYENKEFLGPLKRFGNAIGVDFSTQDIEDAYGRTFKGDIVQRTYQNADGEDRQANEIRNPKKAA